MGVASYVEFVTTLFAWVMYKELWAILVDTGLVFLPLITMLVTHIITSRKAGDDEGSAPGQSLKKIETDFYMMLGVIVFAAIPVVEVELGEMSYAKPALSCDAVPETIQGTNTQTTYDRTLAELNGETGRVPIWWAALHTLSKAVVSASIASIPCAPDLSSVEYRLANDAIEDPGLRKELAQFTEDCYQRAFSRLLRGQTAALTQDQREDLQWLGSEYFLTRSGFYDTYYAQQPQPQFPYNATRDAGFLADAATGGHPRCTEWWSNGTQGIRRKVLDSVEPALIDEMVYATDNLVSQATDQTLSETERENIFLRKYLAINRARENLAVDLPMSTGYRVSVIDANLDGIAQGNILSRLQNGLELGLSFIMDTASTGMVAAGGAIKAPAAIGEGYMIRQGISLFQALVLMVMVTVLPFLMLFSQFRASTVLTLSIIFFGLHFLSFLWAIAFWMDNNLMALMTEGGRYGVFEPVANPVQSGIILWIQRFLYLVLPMIFLAGLGWTGIRASDIGNQMISFGSNIAKPGAAGGEVAKTVATKGKA